MYDGVLLFDDTVGGPGTLSEPVAGCELELFDPDTVPGRGAVHTSESTKAHRRGVLLRGGVGGVLRNRSAGSDESGESEKPWLVRRTLATIEEVSSAPMLPVLAVLAVVLYVLAAGVVDVVGHLEFQLAGDSDGVREVLRANSIGFNKHGFEGVRANIYLDLAFIPVYVLLLIALLRLSKLHWYTIPRLHTMVDLVGITVAFAGLFDLFESLLILWYLPADFESIQSAVASIGTVPPLLASAFAIAKYVALAMGVVVALPVLIGGLWRVVSRKIPFHRRNYLRGLSMQTLNRPEPWSERTPVESPAKVPQAGFCFSGGGIRAGSFALGGIQALQAKGKLGQSPGLMTSVSGGGYLAGAYEMARSGGVFEAGPVEPHPFAPGSPEERYVRNHSAYLTYERGQKTVALGHLTRGIAVNAFAVFVVLYLLLRPIGWALWKLNANLVERASDGSESVLFAIPGAHLLAIGLVLGLSGLAYLATMSPSIVGEADLNEAVTKAGRAAVVWAIAMSAVLLVVPAALWIAFVGFPYLFGWLVQQIPIAEGDDATKARVLTLIGAGGSLAFIGEGVRRQLKKVSTSVWAVLAALVVVPLLLLFVVASIVKGAYVDGVSAGASPFGWDTSELGYWLAILCATLFWSLVSDQRAWSLHRFYKRRLADAFSIRRVEADSVHAEQIPYGQPTYFHTPDGQAPLVVACAANVNDYGASPPGLNATSFTMSEEQIGGPQVGYVKTEVLKERLEEDARRRDITVPAAVAISGAAASPAMGKMSRPFLRFLLAFANVRLGVWFPNPRWLKANGLDEEVTEDERKRSGGVRQWYDRPRLQYLFKEMFGFHSIDDRYLYLTDGGHLDNLGLVELFRRRCTLIYAFDASGGKPGTFSTIGEALAIARADLGVRIELPLERIRPEDDVPPPGSDGAKSWSSAEAGKGWPWSRSCAVRGGTMVKQAHAIGKYRYPDEPPETEHKIIYVQAAATPSIPWAVRWYWEKNPSFPNHTTLDQDFDFREFEAYRSLGYFAAEAAINDAESTEKPEATPPMLRSAQVVWY